MPHTVQVAVQCLLEQADAPGGDHEEQRRRPARRDPSDLHDRVIYTRTRHLNCPGSLLPWSYRPPPAQLEFSLNSRSGSTTGVIC